MRKKGVYVIWLDYFDSTISRRSGRRVPLSIATKHPQLQDLVRAAEESGFNVTRATKASHPKRHRRPSGYIEVEKVNNLTKNEVVLKIAKALTRVKSKS